MMISKRVRVGLAALGLGAALAATLTAAAQAGEGTAPVTRSCGHALKVVRKDGKVLVDDGTGLRELKPGDRSGAVFAVPAVPGESGRGRGVPGAPTGSDVSGEARTGAEEKGTDESGPGDPEKGITEKGTTEKGIAEGTAGKETTGKGTIGKETAPSGAFGHQDGPLAVAVSCAGPAASPAR